MSEQVAATPPKERFNQLADADRERLVAAFEQTEPQLFVRPFATAVAQRAAADAKFVEELCLFLTEWFGWLSENPRDYLDRIAEFLAGTPEGHTQQEVATLRDQWRRVMQADATLGVTLKAFDILRRQANAFQKAVTTTEIRPVYRTDPTLPPTHAIVLHQLHITYLTEFGAQTTHIAFDAQAIAALMSTLERALTKERTLVAQQAYHYLGKVTDADN